MRRILTTAAALILACTSAAQAADNPAKPELQPNPAPQSGPSSTSVLRPQGGPGAAVNGGQGWGPKAQAEGYINSIDKTVSLTDDQKKSITRIFEEQQKTLQDLQAANGEKLKAALKALNDAYNAKDKEAMAKASKEYAAVNAPMMEMYKKNQADLAAVLTKEQQEKLHEFRAASMIKSMTDPATLTDEQLKKIKAALPKEGAERRDNTFYKTVQEVLTDEQKAQIGKHRAMSYVKTMFASAKLTDEQLKKAESAYEEWAKDKSAKPEDMYKALGEKVQGMLTDEQKEAMKKSQAAWGNPGAAIGQPGTPTSPQKK